MIKEIVRHHELDLIEHIDLVFIVRKGALDMPYKDMEKSILHVLRKASLLKQKSR
ncbi:ribonuclease P protein component [Paenibacillus pini JCM 16418]|uniref:Ribonuclease P protein component n=2 Tax=Paenibacillus TaxID=44249 RepID=W7YUH1_9BACL|nr:ribonuclease P protein component [Paenibacillus pini JCM 16418]